MGHPKVLRLRSGWLSYDLVPGSMLDLGPKYFSAAVGPRTLSSLVTPPLSHTCLEFVESFLKTPNYSKHLTCESVCT